MSDLHIRELTVGDLEMLRRHKIRHQDENGRGGDVVFAPVEGAFTATIEDLNRGAEGLGLKPTERGWLRVWILTDEREIFGELTLVHRPPLATSLHRCHLMMGLERKVRSLGFGSKLMTEAIEWAKRVPTLEYISLNVFENNPKAKSLYEKFGFVSEGTTRDLFRVYGQSIDDTQMSLRLR